MSDEYKKKLGRMPLSEIAEEAARFRSNGRRCGTATALILRWAIKNKVARTPDARNFFFGLYRSAWGAEKAAREEGRSERPEIRPAMGCRSSRDSRRYPRMGFVS